MSKKERQFLQVIMRTLNKYQMMLPIIEKMRKEGMSIADIDREVQINDKPAKTAMNLLTTYVTGLESGHWLSLIT